MYPKPAVIRMQAVISSNRDVVRRCQRSRAILEEDATDEFGATYASACITPLNAVFAKTFRYFCVGLCMAGSRSILADSLSLPKKRGDRILADTGAHWFRLIVGNAGGMSRMVRWPRKKPDQNNKRRSRRSRSRGLIDRDVFAVTPASGENVDSRLANRRNDRA